MGQVNFLDLLEKKEKENLPENYLVQISFYYSLRDVYYLFSDLYISKYFTKSFRNTEFLTKKNSHFGKWNINTTPSTPCFSILLHDFYGLSSSEYDNLLKMLDVKNPFKSSPLNKSAMKTELIENFDLFLNYAIADVISLIIKIIKNKLS